VKVDIKRLVLVKDDAHSRDKWRSLTTGNRPALSQCGNEGVILYGFILVTLNISSLLVVYFIVKIAGFRSSGLHPEMGFSGTCSKPGTMYGTDRLNRLVVCISASTWTVQLRYAYKVQAY